MKLSGLEPSPTAELPLALEAYEAGALLRASAASGALAWLAHRLFADADLISSTLVLAVLVIVPLALSLFMARAPEQGLFSWVSVLQPVAALGGVTALTLEPGSATALFAVPWLVFTGLVAGLGILRLASRASVADLAHGLGFLLLPMGGLWLCISRAGLDPLGIGRLMVLLTAVHFHFAAFAALVIIANAAEHFARLTTSGQPPHRSLLITRANVIALGCGTFLVAAGISGAPSFGLFGAALLALALGVHACLSLLYILPRQSGLLARLLLLISSLSILLSMPLAVVWAWGQVTGSALLDFSWMLRLHGMANAHGFVLSGLLAFWLQLRSEARRALPVHAVKTNGALREQP